MAGVLSHLGCDLPKALMPPTEANPKGYFESVKAYHLNDALLASGGSSWDDPAGFNPGWYASPRFPEYRARAMRILEEEYGDSGFFVLKDPRICRLLPFWQDVLSAAGVTPNYVCIHRHPREVAASLSRREGWPETTGLLLWLRHVLEAEVGSRGAPRVFVSYDALMSNWRRTVTGIGEGLHLSWPVPMDRAAPDVDAFLSGELRHFDAGREDLPQTSVTYDWVATVHGILDRWATGEGVATDHEQLDAVKAALDASFPMLGNLLDESRNLGSKLARVEAQLTTVRAESISYATNHLTEQQNRGKAEARLAETERRLEDAARLKTEAEQSASRLAERLSARDQELEAARGALGTAEARLADSERRLGELARLKHEAEQTAAQSNEQLAAREQELDALRGQRQADEGQIARLESELETARTALDAAEARLSEVEDQHEDAARLRRDAEDALAQMKSAFLQRGLELDELRRQAETDTGKIASLESDLAAARKDLDALEKRHARDAKHLAQMARQLAPLIRQELDTMMDRSTAAERATGLEAELQALRASLDAERQAAAGKDANLGQLEGQISALQEELTAVRMVYDRERKRTDQNEFEFQIERTRLTAAVNELGAEVEGLRVELETARAAYNDARELAAQKSAEAADRQRVAEDMARLQVATEVDWLRHELETLRETQQSGQQALNSLRASHEAERIKLERKAAEYEAYKQAITSSTSWRLTAPLRRISQLVRRRG